MELMVMSESLNRLISLGGTNVPSPLERYVQGRGQAQTEQMNRLTMQSTQQDMQQKSQEYKDKVLGNAAMSILQLPEADQERAYAQIVPEVSRTLGADPQQAPPYSKELLTSLMGRAGLKLEPPKGGYFQALDPANPSQPKPAREVSGVIYDTNGVRQPTWIKAPTQTEQRTGLLTSAQEGKEEIDFQDATTATLGMIDVGGDVIKMSRLSPSSLGYSGNILSGVNELVRTADGLISSYRTDLSGDSIQIGNGDNAQIVPKSELGNRYEEELSGFRNSAIYSEEIESALINLAYLAAGAKGQTGHGLSDKDLEMNMKEVGSTTDPIGLERLMKRFVKRTVGSFKNRATVKGKSDSEYMKMVDERMSKFESLWDGKTDAENSFTPDMDISSMDGKKKRQYLEWLNSQ